MRLFRTHFILALALTSCGKATDDGAINNQPSGQVENAKNYIKFISKDPDSITFRNVSVFYGSKYEQALGVVVCGEFNGRNSFGGYGGYEQFAYQYKGQGVEPFFISDSMIGNGQGGFALFFQNKLCINSADMFDDTPSSSN